MSKLQMVYVASRLDAYLQETYDIKTKDGNYMCRENIANRQQAYQIAESIDASLIYERDNGAGSLEVI
ncbi:MAG: hypothetical protein HHJ15_18080 [Rhodoferax sp.]|uniref:hypothetical protein n=1 Tax=Rhodoferax sp. TaxID=50421 RepID=UPI0018166BE4|nr:hypothetical protein [Rhodoferax sp.]NMM21831.1 hypothetical protein [Rhodoferax sp.]